MAVLVRGSCFRQRFQRQQDRSLGIAARCGLLRKKRKRKRLVAQRLVACLEAPRCSADLALSALSCANSACRVASCCPLNPTNAPAPAKRANTVARWPLACARELRARRRAQRSASRSRRSRFAASAASISARSACRSASFLSLSATRRRLDVLDDLIVDFLPSRQQQFLALGETLARWQQKLPVPVIRHAIGGRRP